MIIDPAKGVDPARFRGLSDLEAGLRFLPATSPERGGLSLIVSRTELGHHELVDPVGLTPGAGVPGDAWFRKEGATVETAITVMETSVAELIANRQPLALFGDNLFVELDLSMANLPPGSRVSIGGALLEVTTKVHKGCRKFAARFGLDALRFVATPQGRAGRFRGLYLSVIEAGEIAPGDTIEVRDRAPAAEGAAV